MSGNLFPETLLNASLISPFFETATAITASRQADGYDIALQQNELELSAFLDNSFNPQSANIMGDFVYTLENLGLEANLNNANLSWQSETGFSGDAELQANWQDSAQGSFTLIGNNKLTANGTALWQGTPITDASITLSSRPWEDQNISGRLQIANDVGNFVGSIPAELLQVQSVLELSGTYLKPQIAGDLSTLGAVESSGLVNASLEGATINLNGEGVAINASASQENWSANVNLDGWQTDLNEYDVSLPFFTPEGSSLTLSGILNASQTWGDSLRADAQNLNIQSANSLVQGDVSLLLDDTSPQVNANLSLDVAAADVDINQTPLQGRVSGDVQINYTLNQPILDLTANGTLKAERLGLADNDALLSGDIRVQGNLRNPELELALIGEGSASGSLTGNLFPQQQLYQLESSLQLEPIRTDVTVIIQNGQVNANGTVDVLDYSLAFAESSNDTLRLVGLEQLEGWQLDVNIQEQTAAVIGKLAGVVPQAQGDIALSANLNLEQVNWLTGAPHKC